MTPFFDLSTRGRARRLRRLARRALEAYPVDVAAIRMLTIETNGIFRVDAVGGQRFVLRIGRAGNIGHSTAQVRSETEWLAALGRDTDLRVPEPVESRQGEHVTTVEADGVPEPRDCVLFRWLPGRQLDRDLDTLAMRAYGALAVRLHEHAAAFRPSAAFEIVRYDRVFPFEEPVVLLDPERSTFATQAQREVFAAGVELVSRAIGDLRRREPMRVIHGDLHRWNVLAEPRRGGREPTVGAIDFEDLMWGWPVQDLAIALYYLHEEPAYPAMREAFRAGYEKLRPWPDETGDEIDTFIAGRALVLANDVELLEEPEVRAEAPDLMDRFERRVRRVLDRASRA